MQSYQAIAWTNVTNDRWGLIVLATEKISQEIFHLIIVDMGLKMIDLILQPHRPGADELNEIRVRDSKTDIGI